MIPALHYVIYKIRNTDMNFCLEIPNVNDEKAIHLRWKRPSLKVSQQNLSLGANYNEKLCTLIVGEFQLQGHFVSRCSNCSCGDFVFAFKHRISHWLLISI